MDRVLLQVSCMSTLALRSLKSISDQKHRQYFLQVLLISQGFRTLLSNLGQSKWPPGCFLRHFEEWVIIANRGFFSISSTDRDTRIEGIGTRFQKRETNCPFHTHRVKFSFVETQSYCENQSIGLRSLHSVSLVVLNFIPSHFLQPSSGLSPWDLLHVVYGSTRKGLLE